MTKKMVKKKKEGNLMKEVQFFDYTDMPFKFEEMETTLIIAGSYEGCGNDSYHRWYPDRISEKKIGEFEHFETKKEWKAGKALNDWLLGHGMIVKDEFCFHILIHVSW